MTDDVALFDFDAMTVTLDTGAAIPIVHMFDVRGDECADWEDAVSLVAGPAPDGGWLSIDLGAFDFVTIH